MAKRVDSVTAILDKFNSSGQEGRPSCLQSNSEFIDPVCKMAVHAEGNKWLTIHNGKKFYFCCRECKDKFIRTGS